MAEMLLATPLRGGSASIEPLGPFARAILRCREGMIDAVSGAIGVALPRSACQAATGDAVSALWLGPDEWLLIASQPGEEWFAILSSKLAALTCSLVDVSHRQVALGVSGHRATDILESGCPLDLSLPKFPVGMCTRTLFQKAEVVLWRRSEQSFHVEVWRSFARYVEALIVQADGEG